MSVGASNKFSEKKSSDLIHALKLQHAYIMKDVVDRPFTYDRDFKWSPDDVESSDESVKVISYGPFSPYKSHFHREVSNELRLINKHHKRSISLISWKWDEVNYISSGNAVQSTDGDLEDTADSFEVFKRKKIDSVGKTPPNDDVKYVRQLPDNDGVPVNRKLVLK